MYKCGRCGYVFTEPSMECDKQTGYGCERCPNCGCDEIYKVNCCRCGEVKAEGEILCDDCRAVLAATMRMVLGTMSKEELDQIDEWMDGESVHDFKEWR